MTHFRIGTRRSSLALAQAEEVRASLARHDIESELVPMTTSGDEGAVPEPGSAGLKGLFVDAIQESLEEGEIDLAVHSAKDLPTEDDGFVIAAVPPRADPFDVLVLHAPKLPDGARIGTSSLRRRAQLLAIHPGVRVVDLRGNVDTRLRKVAQGELDAAVLAAAGLARLGARPSNVMPMTLEGMVPAPGQGALALQTREDDFATRAALAAIDHRESHLAVEAERSLTWRLGGGCDLPLGAYATVQRTGRIELVALVASADGDRVIRVHVEGEGPEDAAALAAKELISQGAEAILEGIER